MRELYITDSYLKSFEARVEAVTDGKFVVLDKTAFYPKSGGQPHDTGVLVRDGEEYPVVYASLFGGKISHEVGRPGLEAGDKMKGSIDWDRRYLFMRSHTACHLLSAVIFKETGAMITGNQIGEDRSRVDFSLEEFDRSRLAEYVDQTNSIIKEDRSVKTAVIPRDEAMKIPDLVRLAKDVPDREEIRVVEVEGIDLQACGGTHVRRTGEIKGVKMLKAENKGKANRRVYFGVCEGD
ncbi:MAG: alanyl-tRNA editing protein AlaX [Methanosaeta sp. SDB]|nr:MAG: alanyl-tRNA editing protein AlaX [Methanosaeta sp. SDB]